MDKFEFLIGNWNLEYRVPESKFSQKATGTGSGQIRRILNDKYVAFDYVSDINGKKGEAHAVFAWDAKAEVYRFWWFENSGNFSMATCGFSNKDTLCLNWHDSLLHQTFRKIGDDKVLLRMDAPNAEGDCDLILEVLLTRV